MGQQINRTYISEIVHSQMLGQKRREKEFSLITKEIISFYYKMINCNNEKVLEATYNWIVKNIMNLPDKENFVPWTIQIASVSVLCTKTGNFLQNAIPEEYKRGISYPYLKVDQDTEEFLPKNLMAAEAMELTKVLWDTSNEDLKILAGLFFIGGMSIGDIAESSEGKVADIASGIQLIKTKLHEKVASNQKSPDGEFESLSDKNELLIGFEESFFIAYNQKYITEEEEKTGITVPSKEIKTAILEEVQVNTEEKCSENEVVTKIIIEDKNETEDKELHESIAVETEIKNSIKKEKNKKSRRLLDQIPKITIERAEKSKEEKKSINDKQYYVIMLTGIAMSFALIVTFIVKIVISMNNNKIVDNTQIAEENLAQDQENDIVINEQVTRLTEAYQNQVGTVSIILSGTTNEAPRTIENDDAYYFYGSNYEFDLQYTFNNAANESSIVDCAEIALEYTDRTEHFSKDGYYSRKEEAISQEQEECVFNDEAQTITTFSDWQETDMHTAIEYEKDDCITTWLSVLDSNRVAIETMGDGCDLLPVMAENLTTTINGETYELVFYSAKGYFIKDDDLVDTEGHSTNYTIVCNAYLETF